MKYVAAITYIYEYELTGTQDIYGTEDPVAIARMEEEFYRAEPDQLTKFAQTRVVSVEPCAHPTAIPNASQPNQRRFPCAPTMKTSR